VEFATELIKIKKNNWKFSNHSPENRVFRDSMLLHRQIDIIETILFFFRNCTAHSKTTTECVDAFFALNKKYNDFMA
jgi:hypothetical protein